MVYRRQKVYLLKDQTGKVTKKVFEEEPDDEPSFSDGDEYIVTCTRWFLLRDTTKQTFIES